MKVLLFNGSPRLQGNTAAALREIAATLEHQGIETELISVGNHSISGCLACDRCHKLGHCVIESDIINEIALKCQDADGFVFGTPVYYASANGTMISFMDRLFYSNGKALSHKPAAAVAVARRAGTTATLDVLNKYFTISQMPVVASTYWNCVFGTKQGEAALDTEGMQTMRNLASNLAWLLQCIETGKSRGLFPPEEERGCFMNFIR